MQALVMMAAAWIATQPAATQPAATVPGERIARIAPCAARFLPMSAPSLRPAIGVRTVLSRRSPCFRRAAA